MNTFSFSFVGLMNYIRGIATSISETFTGSNSGAVLIMIVFYLVVLILIFLLAKGLIRLIKSIFKPSRHKISKNSVIKTESSVSSDATNVEPVTENQQDALIPSFLNDFDSQPFLDVLAQKYNTINTFDDVFDKQQPVVDTAPALLVLDKSAHEELSADERAAIISEISKKDISELKQQEQQLLLELTEIDNKLESIDKSLANNCKNREKLVQETLSATEKYNLAVGEIKALKTQFDTNKTNISVEYSHLFNFISELEAQKQSVIEQIYSIKDKIALITEKTESFNSSYEQNITSFLDSVRSKEEILTALKDSCLNINQLRAKTDEIIASLQTDYKSLSKKKLQLKTLSSETKLKLDELEKLEAERLAKEEEERLARLEAERKAKEEAERQAKIEAEKREKERLAQIEAERKAREEAEKRAREEAERKTKEEAERIAREKAEAEAFEKERIAREMAEKAAMLEAEQKAAEELERQSVASDKPVSNTSDGQETSGSTAVDTVKKQVENQVQNAYVLNFDNISPEMMKKLALDSEKRKKDAQHAIKSTRRAEEVPSESEPDAPEQTTGATDTPSDSDTDPVDQAPGDNQQIDYITELRKQWAEARAHKEEWEAEVARRKAEEEARKKELSRTLSSTENSDDKQ